MGGGAGNQSPHNSQGGSHTREPPGTQSSAADTKPPSPPGREIPRAEHHPPDVTDPFNLERRGMYSAHGK